MCFLLSNLFSALCQGKKAACRCWKQRQNSIQISVNPRGVAADSDNSLNVNHRGWRLSYCHMSSLDISPGAWRISFPKHVRHRTCFLNFSIIYWLYWIFTFFWGHISQYQLRRLSGVFSDSLSSRGKTQKHILETKKKYRKRKFRDLTLRSLEHNFDLMCGNVSFKQTDCGCSLWKFKKIKLTMHTRLNKKWK